ncbi:transcriptional regulator [Halostella sp. PRR32]|uniref:RAD55 family ATPase n=1 Tax=Halostella sp. PRR32 TaxID=3098147 RepID=UPI002B1E611E|nr:transcriptional regulator [Halostella sp. PRR32]
MAKRLSTGVTAIDRNIGGGVFAGSIVVLLADPDSQSEPLLHEFMEERPTAYITTLRTEAAVRDDLDRSLRNNDYTVQYAGIDTPIDNANRVVQQVDGQANVIVDTLNPLEATGERNRYVNFLNQFKTHLVNTGGVGVLHCTGLDAPALRETTLTIADAVWRLEMTVKGNSVENFLRVSKLRGGDPADETIKLDLGEEVAVDTSRDIA